MLKWVEMFVLPVAIATQHANKSTLYIVPLREMGMGNNDLLVVVVVQHFSFACQCLGDKDTNHRCC